MYVTRLTVKVVYSASKPTCIYVCLCIHVQCTCIYMYKDMQTGKIGTKGCHKGLVCYEITQQTAVRLGGPSPHPTVSVLNSCMLECGPMYTLVVSTTGVRSCSLEDSCARLATSQNPLIVYRYGQPLSIWVSFQVYRCNTMCRIYGSHKRCLAHYLS